MSSDERSREALTPEENSALLASFIRMNPDEFTVWGKEPANVESIELADESTRAAFDKKRIKFSAGDKMKDIIDSKKAPAVISEQTPSEKPKPPESDDIEIVTWAEHRAGGPTHTMEYINVPVGEGEVADSRIERVIGRDHQTKKLRVTYQPAKKVKILPEWVLRYRGSVVLDRNAVHSNFVTYKKQRYGYSFGNFFNHNGKKLNRCCLVQDRIHQAALLYEKHVPKNASKALVRIRPLKGTDDPMYELVKKTNVSGDYRDLKTLFIRHFLKKNDQVMGGDPALEKLISEAYPDV